MHPPYVFVLKVTVRGKHINPHLQLLGAPPRQGIRSPLRDNRNLYWDFHNNYFQAIFSQNGYILIEISIFYGSQPPRRLNGTREERRLNGNFSEIWLNTYFFKILFKFIFLENSG